MSNGTVVYDPGAKLVGRLGLIAVCWLLAGCVHVDTSVMRDQAVELAISQDQLPLNHFQFFGSHNSYKQAMSAESLSRLRDIDPATAAALDYWHEPLAAQLDLGVRVLELDIFYDPQARLFAEDGDFRCCMSKTWTTTAIAENCGNASSRSLAGQI